MDAQQLPAFPRLYGCHPCALPAILGTCHPATMTCEVNGGRMLKPRATPERS